MKTKNSENTEFLLPTIFLIVNCIVLLFIFLNKDSLPPQIPLWYGRPIGADQLANKYYIFLPTSISIFYIIGSMFILKKMKDKFLIKIIIGTIFLSTVLTSFTTIKIVNLII